MNAIALKCNQQERKSVHSPTTNENTKRQTNDVKRKRSGAFSVGKAFLDLSPGERKSHSFPHFTVKQRQPQNREVYSVRIRRLGKEQRAEGRRK